jgi:hypothetical protein
MRGIELRAVSRYSLQAVSSAQAQARPVAEERDKDGAPSRFLEPASLVVSADGSLVAAFDLFQHRAAALANRRVVFILAHVD